MNRFHALLLRCFPAMFRERFGAELLLVFEAEWRDARQRGLAPLVLFMVASAADAVVNGARERRSHRSHSPRSRRDPFMTTFLADLKYGLRLLIRNPRLAVLAVGTLALGIGLSVSLYSVAHGTLVRPLPFRDEARVVMMYEHAPQQGNIRGNVAPANFLDWRERSRAFSHMGLLRPFSVTVAAPGSDPVRADGRRIYGEAFAALGLDPLLGRLFDADDEQPGARVVILSYRLWQQQFGADRAVVGRAIALDDVPHTVIGVLKPVQRVPGGPLGYDEIFVPWVIPPPLRQQRMSHISEAVARIKDGVTHEQAQADIAAVAEGLAREYPQSNKDESVLLVPLREALVGEVKPALVMLVGAVTLVLIIACVNVASLLLARATGRRQEMMVRTALGAGRARLFRQLLAESVTLGAIAGLAGLVLAYWFAASLAAMLPAELAVAIDARIDRTVAAAALAICVATAVLFGLAPAWFVVRRGAGDVVREGRGSAASGRGRQVLVVVQVALAVVLLTGAGLLLRSFVRLTAVQPGFQSDRLLTLGIELPRSRYNGPDEWEPFFNRLIAELESLPGVESAAAVSGLPLNENGGSVGYYVEGQPLPRDNEHQYVIYRLVTPGYFKTFRIPMIEGRDFTSADRPAASRVVIVNQTFANRYWPRQPAIGKRVAFTTTPTAADWATVVGVAGDTHHWSLAEDIDVQLYVPYTQEPDWFPPGQIALRTSVEPLSLAAAARERVRAIDPLIPVSDIQTMSDILGKSVAAPRFNLTLLGMLSLSALALASVGIYGLLAFSVALRTREIGVRSALGASRAAISTMILRDGLRLTAAGIVAGLAIAFAGAGWLDALLFQIEPYDAATFAGVPALLLTIAAVACYVPARRAARVDPLVALRSE